MKLSDHWAHKTPANASVVKISWRDIRDISNWDGDGDLRPARRLLTVGWLLYDGIDPEDNEGGWVTVLAKSYDYDEQQWADFTIFPKIVVKKIKICTVTGSS